MKKITIRIDEALAERLQQEMGNLTSAGTRMVEVYGVIRAKSIEKIKKSLSQSELLLILEAENGLLFSPNLIGGYVSHIEDSMQIDRLHEKYAVDPHELLLKLQALPISDIIVLHDWMNYYWYGKHKKKPSMTEYIS